MTVSNQPQRPTGLIKTVLSKKTMRQRVQIRFAKQGDLRMISHRDLLRTLERLFRRAQLELRMSEGFHPKPRMSFPSALAVGIAGADEIMELDLEEADSQQELLTRLRENTVPGLEFKSLKFLAPDRKKGQPRSVTFEIPVPAERQPGIVESIQCFLAESEHLVTRPRRTAPVDVRRDVQQLQLADDRLTMRLGVTRDASVRPREVLEVLGLADLEDQGYYLTRTGVQLDHEMVKKES